MMILPKEPVSQVQEIKPTETSYYLIIPAHVADSKELSDREKMLFGRLSGLTSSIGYCYATNKYLSEKCNASLSSVKAWINNLKNLGFIHVEVIRDEKNEVIERRIFVDQTPRVNTNLPPQPAGCPTPQPESPPPQPADWPTPQPADWPYNNKELNTKEKNAKKSVNEPGLETSLYVSDKLDKSKAKAFERFWKAYPRKEAKGFAEKSLSKALKITSIDEIIRAVECYAKKVQGTDKQFIALPATWLNAQRWLDDDINTDSNAVVSKKEKLEEQFKDVTSNCEEKWKIVCEKLVESLGLPIFMSWFSEIRLVSIASGVVLLSETNSFKIDHIKQTYFHDLKNAIFDVYGKIDRLEFQIKPPYS